MHMTSGGGAAQLLAAAVAGAALLLPARAYQEGQHDEPASGCCSAPGSSSAWLLTLSRRGALRTPCGAGCSREQRGGVPGAPGGDGGAHRGDASANEAGARRAAMSAVVHEQLSIVQRRRAPRE
jgi:hypothetical protein